MAKRLNHIHELVGDTPVVRLNRVVPEGSATVWAKLEYANPGASVKDRIAKSMIEDAESRGVIKPGVTTIVEGTSGNTGIGLALIAASKGYAIKLAMPESMSIERRTTLKALGAEIVLTKKELGVKGAVDAAAKVVSENDNHWNALQFDNPANPRAHALTTAPEILQQVPEIDAFVAGVGTGGTITGTGRVLKTAKPEIKIYAVEPIDAPILNGGQPGPHKIQGIGPNFVPSILDREVYDKVFDIEYADAIAFTRRLAREEGIFSGISAGAIGHAAVQVAKELGEGKSVVFIVPDFGERYGTHELWADA